MTIRGLLTAAAVLCLTLGGAAGGFVVSEGPAPQISPRRQSLLRVYWHDIISGRRPTTLLIARAAGANASATFFGEAFVADNPLTEGPEMSSRLVGRAQGLYASASQSEVGLIMAMNFAFTEGRYNGSTVTILGRNTPFSKVRELPVIGGSGLFRFATGYCKLKTHRFDLTTGDAVVEYNIFLLHQ